MKTMTRHPAPRRLAAVHLLAFAALGLGVPASAAAAVLNFEGVPADFNYDVLGLNLGAYYASEVGGPTFGPQATVLEVGGSLNSVTYPPHSGVGSLWGEGFDIQLSFTTGVAKSVSLYYRSNADVSVFAYDPFDNLLGSASGPASLGGDPAGFLALDSGAFDIARVLISGPPGAFVIDDVSFSAIPEPGAGVLIAGLGLAGFACWRRGRSTTRRGEARSA